MWWSGVETTIYLFMRWTFVFSVDRATSVFLTGISILNDLYVWSYLTRLADPMHLVALVWKLWIWLHIKTFRHRISKFPPLRRWRSPSFPNLGLLFCNFQLMWEFLGSSEGGVRWGKFFISIGAENIVWRLICGEIRLGVESCCIWGFENICCS